MELVIRKDVGDKSGLAGQSMAGHIVFAFTSGMHHGNLKIGNGCAGLQDRNHRMIGDGPGQSADVLARYKSFLGCNSQVS